MSTKFSEDVIPLADLKANPGRVVKHESDTRRPVLLTSRGRGRAPAYDFVATIAWLPDETAALKVSRTKRFDGFSEDELAHMAARARLPEKIVLDAARETVALFHEHWQAEKRNLPLAADVVAAVEAHMKNVPLVKPAAGA